MHGCRNSNACKITSKSLAHWNRLCCSKCGCRIPETNCRRCRRAKWAEEPKSPPSLESPGHHRSLSCSGNFETVFHRLLFQIANKSLFLVWCSKHLKMPVPVMLQYVFQAVRWVDPVSRVAIIEENCTFYCVLWSQYNETHSISYSIHIEWYISKTKLILSQPFLSNNNCKKFFAWQPLTPASLWFMLANASAGTTLVLMPALKMVGEVDVRWGRKISNKVSPEYKLTKFQESITSGFILHLWKKKFNIYDLVL